MDRSAVERGTGAYDKPLSKEKLLAAVKEEVPMFKSPVPFYDNVESPVDGEKATRRELISTLLTISETTFRDSEHATRALQARGHGPLRGELTVLGGLPSELAQGLFSHPRAYPVAMRFSTSPGDILEDRISAPRGLAVKALDVEGERLAGGGGGPGGMKTRSAGAAACRRGR
jgi:hypothetical protein